MLGRPHVVINCRGKLVGRRVEAYWTVRRWRDPTRRLGIRGLSEWRPDRGGEWGVVDSPRLIVTLAARHQLPVVYPYRVFVTGGGLTKVDAGHGSSASTDQPPPPRPPQRHRRHRARGWPRSQGQLALDYSHGRKLAFEPRGRFPGRHEIGRRPQRSAMSRSARSRSRSKSAR